MAVATTRIDYILTWLINTLEDRRRAQIIGQTNVQQEVRLADTVRKPVSQLRFSERGIKLLKQFEGFRSAPYRDAAGVWTNGYGNTWGVNQFTAPITEPEADRLLRAAVEVFERDLRFLVKAPLSQNEFDALLLFTYNVGSDIDDDDKAEGLGDSTLLKKLNAFDYYGASNEFLKWVYAKGKKLKGLQARREKERELFLT